MKHCARCNAEMDDDEIVCPQCGHGLEEQAARKAAALKRSTVDLSDLAGKWDSMRPAARRRAVISRILGTDRRLFARIAGFFGVSRGPTPPAARRVAARALVLATVVGRAFLEQDLRNTPNAEAVRAGLLAWLHDLGIADELEPGERAFLDAPPGHVDSAIVANWSWRAEGLAVLSWALGRSSLPAYDEPVNFFHAQQSVGFSDLETAKQLLSSASLLPASEIDLLAAKATIVTWRMRTFRMGPGPWDLAGHLRSQPSFQESWLAGLRGSTTATSRSAHNRSTRRPRPTCSSANR